MTKKQLIITVILPVLISIIIGVVIILFHNEIGIASIAHSVVSTEKRNMSDELSHFQKEKAELLNKQSEYDKVINENSTLISEVDTLKKELENYETDISNAKERNSELDTQLQSKRLYLDNLSKIGNQTEGEQKKLKTGEYKCPSEIESARYKAEGTGKIYVYTIANSLKDNVDLSVIDSHSYTFDLSSGEKIKIDGEVNLTKINSN